MEPEGAVDDCDLPLPLYEWGPEVPRGADGLPNWDGAELGQEVWPLAF